MQVRFLQGTVHQSGIHVIFDSVNSAFCVQGNKGLVKDGVRILKKCTDLIKIILQINMQFYLKVQDELVNRQLQRDLHRTADTALPFSRCFNHARISVLYTRFISLFGRASSTKVANSVSTGAFIGFKYPAIRMK